MRPSDHWAADQRINLNTATDLQSTLELLVQRYHLLGGVIADSRGTVKAQTGGQVESLQELAAAIDVSVLPRYYANGPYDAYVDIVGDRLIALLIRERPENSERTELNMVSDYAVAKEMTEELKAALGRL